MPPSRKNHTNRFAAAGFATLLASGCVSPRTTPPAITDDMATAEKMQTTFLITLYNEIRANMMQHSPEALAEKLVKWKPGINVSNMQQGDETRIYIMGSGAGDGIEKCLYFRIDSLLKQLEAMKQANILPPTAYQVENIIVSAVYSVLMDEKYQGMTLESYNVQPMLKTPIISTMIYRTVETNVGKIMEASLAKPLAEAAQEVVTASTGRGR